MKNNICICSFIKDELEYLEEFITYHLGIGIDHIFLFEDYNSLSHKPITDKYSDKVTLQNIQSLIPKPKLLSLSTKEQHRQRQPEYLHHGLSYIQSKNVYDWCLVIDTDEYLTLNKTDITEVLNNYAKYEAVKILWQNYNANGYVYKPDYNKKNIQETYTQPCGFTNFDKRSGGIVKLLFNLKLFKLDHIINVHCVHSDCKILEKTDELYLRHYITKSWEEFVWKLKIRGMFYIQHRNFNDFFEMNPELIPKKTELLDIAQKILKNDERVL